MTNEKTIDYYFTVPSPWSYLGHDRFMKPAADTGLEVRFHPVDFGVVFAGAGGLPLPKRAPQRQRYRLFELQRWRDRLGLPLTLHPKYFPSDAAPSARAILAAARTGLDVGAFAGTLMRACWVEDRDAADPATAVAEALGANGDALLAQAETPEIHAEAKAETEAAVKAQVFGAPSWIYRGELFWGQDRLDFLDDLVRGRRQPFSVP